MWDHATRLGTVLLLPALVACSEMAAPEGEGESSDELIGGAVTSSAEAGATLRVRNGCTAAKVGPRHVLTAAHCVYDNGGLRAQYASGQTVWLEPGNGAVPRPYRVRTTHVHPTWVSACAQIGCVGGDGTQIAASDTALIETVDAIVDVPTARVDAAPLPSGAVVTVSGYGCEDTVMGIPTWLRSALGSRLKMADTSLLPAEATLHAGSRVQGSQLVSLARYKLVTPGPAYATPGPGLCPGDSGGPLYRANTGRLVVVGVNASYTFSSLTGGLPVTNWHSRLDDGSPAKLATWLASLGASVCHGAACPGTPPASGALAVAENAGLEPEGRDGACQDALRGVAGLNDAVVELLGTRADCQVFDARRLGAAPSEYAYGGSVLCSLQTRPGADAVAGFTAGMQARGYAGSGSSTTGGSPSARRGRPRARRTRLASSGAGTRRTTWRTSGQRSGKRSARRWRTAPHAASRALLPAPAASTTGEGSGACSGAPPPAAVASFQQAMDTYAASGRMGRKQRFYGLPRGPARRLVVRVRQRRDLPLRIVLIQGGDRLRRRTVRIPKRGRRGTSRTRRDSVRGADGPIRTDTLHGLNVMPLPLGYVGGESGALARSTSLGEGPEKERQQRT